MFTHTIKSIDEINKRATVVFTKDTGEMETYTEQVTVADAVFATETTPFIPPVVELREHTRPKILSVERVVSFRNAEDMQTRIQQIEDELNGVVPEPEPVPEPTSEDIAREFWLEKWREYLKAKTGMAELADAGITPTAEETTRFNALKQWVADNRKIEYTQYL